ncbi:aminotransferase class IV [Bernardetia sp.]|uniref:aminotransferase class IV n=1 Tax=Bernardetia sp. TaxID=1937974 RepID=UPI0025C6B53A|nr:aminotransferase class IV [Bernardetia sp.]
MLNHNGKVYTDKNTLLFSAQNRAFSYSDAFFETIRVIKKNSENYHIPLWNYHFNRLSKGMQAFGYDKIESDVLKNEILKTAIASKNKDTETDFKTRLTVFRSEGGLYTPTNTKSEFVIVLTEIPKLTTNLSLPINKKYVFFDDLPLFPSRFSSFKKASALSYILAGKYRKEHQADEVFLLNDKGRIAEAGAANVFILDKSNKNQLHFITPPASEGGVMGTLRNYLLDHQENFDIRVEEKPITKQQLESSEIIFTTNAVQSVQLIKVLKNEQLERMKIFVEKVNQIFR